MKAITLKQYDHIEEVRRYYVEHYASGYAQMQVIRFHSFFTVLCHSSIYISLRFIFLFFSFLLLNMFKNDEIDRITLQ